MWTFSLRWRLLLTYIAIAVTASVFLGAALLITLYDYYGSREVAHMQRNAQTVTQAVNDYLASNQSLDGLEQYLRDVAFITQSRVRVLDIMGSPLVDSGSPPTVLALSNEGTFTAAVPNVMIDPSIDNSGNPMPTAIPPMPIIEVEQAETGSFTLPSMTPTPLGTVPDLSLSTVNTQANGATLIIDGLTSSAQSMDPDAQFTYFSMSSTPYGFDLIGEYDPVARSNRFVRQVLYSPNQQFIGYVEISESLSFGWAIVQNVAQTLLFASVLALLGAGTVGWWISRQISRPLIQLTHNARQMAQGQLSARASIAGRDEIGLLGRTFNEMAAQVEATINALRRFVADAAHELHTPLTALRADLELARTETDPQRRENFVIRAHTQVARMEALTDNLLDLSRLETRSKAIEPVRLELIQTLREMSEAYASRAEQASVSFTVVCPNEPVCILGDLQQIRRAAGNLLDNAIKFTPSGGEVTLRLTIEGQHAIISVQDSGIGIPDEDLPHLFNRFHRGRNTQNIPGSGLGLAILKAIVEAHQGELAVTSQPGDTCFTIRLPLA